MSFYSNSLFVGDLPKFCTEADLEQVFAPFGPLLDVKIKRNNNTGKSLSYGFVTFPTLEAADEARVRVDGCMLMGRKLRIRWAAYNAKSQPQSQESVINSVYIRFVTPRLDQLITEVDLHKVFDGFGYVDDVSIKESSIDPCGYGFVHFSAQNEGIEAAFQAVSKIDNATIDGVTYNVELSRNLLKQFNAGGGAGAGGGDGSGRSRSGSGASGGLSQSAGYSSNNSSGHDFLRHSSAGSIGSNEDLSGYGVGQLHAHSAPSLYPPYQEPMGYGIAVNPRPYPPSQASPGRVHPGLVPLHSPPGSAYRMSPTQQHQHAHQPQYAQSQHQHYQQHQQVHVHSQPMHAQHMYVQGPGMAGGGGGGQQNTPPRYVSPDSRFVMGHMENSAHPAPSGSNRHMTGVPSPSGSTPPLSPALIALYGQSSSLGSNQSLSRNSSSNSVTSQPSLSNGIPSNPRTLQARSGSGNSIVNGNTSPATLPRMPSYDGAGMTAGPGSGIAALPTKAGSFDRTHPPAPAQYYAQAYGYPQPPPPPPPTCYGNMGGHVYNGHPGHPGYAPQMYQDDRDAETELSTDDDDSVTGGVIDRNDLVRADQMSHYDLFANFEADLARSRLQQRAAPSAPAPPVLPVAGSAQSAAAGEAAAVPWGLVTVPPADELSSSFQHQLTF